MCRRQLLASPMVQASPMKEHPFLGTPPCPPCKTDWIDGISTASRPQKESVSLVADRRSRLAAHATIASSNSQLNVDCFLTASLPTGVAVWFLRASRKNNARPGAIPSTGGRVRRTSSGAQSLRIEEHLLQAAAREAASGSPPTLRESYD